MSIDFTTAQVLVGSSGNVSSSAAAATLTSASGRLAWVSGFAITAAGATAAAAVTATLTGLVGGTQSYTFSTPAGAAAAATPLVVNFPTPLPANGQNQNIALNLPSLTSGNTNTCVVIWGYLTW